MISEERIIQEFMELVQVDSETKHEEEISKVLKHKFSVLGFDVIEDDAREKTGHGAGNLIITWKADEASRKRLNCYSPAIWTP